MKNVCKIHLIGNAHIDPVWLWRWQEGFAEVKATFRSVLDRMKEYPEFIFTCAGAVYYKWVEENAPEMFEEIRELVKEGRWTIVGGWWIQPDCNIPSGESFVRHGLYSQRYFLEKFGLMSKVGYSVDSFGHNGMLPQILKKSGMDYYVFMRPGDQEKDLPGNLFWWESEDGSRIMAFKIHFSYSNWWSEEGDPVEQKILAVQKLSEEQEIDFMNFFGVGNHGGGPTIANLELIRILQKKYGEGKLIISSPNKYFEEISKQNLCIPIIKDDLQHHASGCYSTHAETKANNRKSEHRLLTAEKYASFACHLLEFSYPGIEIRRAWENVMFNQFHDIMGGCSIKEAYQDARESYGQSLHMGAEILNAALQKISWSINTLGNEAVKLSKEKDWALWEKDDRGVPLVVFNPLSWEVAVPIQVNKTVRGITDENGRATDIQIVRGPQTNVKDKWDTLFIGNIPAMGYRVFWIYKDKEFKVPQALNSLIAEDAVLENDWLRLEIEPQTGYIGRLFDKKNCVDVLDGKGAVPIIIDEHDSDTWAHGIFEFRNEIGRFSDAEVKLLEKGPLRARIRATSRYNCSILQQDFILYRDKEDIEIRVKLDWREKHKMLKLSFPVNVKQLKATYEIPYGFIERPVNGEEEPGQQWLDVSGTLPYKEEQYYGLTILNDCKYSFDVKNNDLRMTVVRSPIFADHLGERDDYCEHMDQGIHEFRYALVAHAGDWKEAGITKKAYELNVSPVQIIETYHKGTLPQKFEGVWISADNIIAAVFKKAEDEEGYMLRCYEVIGQTTDAVIEIPMLNKKWTANFGKCEIKTFRISFNTEEEVVENNLVEF